MFRLHKFDSQLQCTVEMNNKKTWTKHIKSKQTSHDMRDNKTNVKTNADSGGKVSQYYIQLNRLKEGMMLNLINLCYYYIGTDEIPGFLL